MRSNVLDTYAGASPETLSIAKVFKLKDDGALLPFSAYELLTGHPLGCVGKVKFRELSVEGNSFFVACDEGADLTESLALKDHFSVAPNESFLGQIEAALKFISNVPLAWAAVTNFVKTIVVVDRNDGVETPLVTSCTLPEFPGMIIFSRKALRHIPPSSVSTVESNYLLAENIFHESIHQLVNIGILFGGLLDDRFDSNTSPRIEIPWRQNLDSRNSSWEVDRVLHAASVYVKLIEWRRSLLSNGDVDKETSDLISTSLSAAIASAGYLISALESHGDALGDGGREFVSMLRNEFDKETTRLVLE